MLPWCLGVVKMLLERMAWMNEVGRSSQHLTTSEARPQPSSAQLQRVPSPSRSGLGLAARPATRTGAPRWTRGKSGAFDLLQDLSSPFSPFPLWAKREEGRLGLVISLSENSNSITAKEDSDKKDSTIQASTTSSELCDSDYSLQETLSFFNSTAIIYFRLPTI
jgi:hypothetical protein